MATSTKLQSKHYSKEEKEARLEQEEKLRGSDNNLDHAPSWLNRKQKRVFKDLVSELKNSGILSNLDVQVLTTYSIAVERLRAIEEMVNKDSTLLQDKTLMATKSKYTSDIFTCIKELGLSPSARAKIGALNVQAQNDENDELAKILRGEDIE